MTTLIRVTHDGKCKMHNFPGQELQTLSDVPAHHEFINKDDVHRYLTNIGYTGIEHVTIFVSFEKTIDYRHV